MQQVKYKVGQKVLVKYLRAWSFGLSQMVRLPVDGILPGIVVDDTLPMYTVRVPDHGYSTVLAAYGAHECTAPRPQPPVPGMLCIGCFESELTPFPAEAAIGGAW